MKNLYPVFMALLLVSASVKGQVTATGSNGVTGTYPTLKTAFDAINNGDHQGEINVRIKASTTEIATARLNASGGASRYIRVNIRPTAACTVSGNIAGPLIDLNGADNVTIDGRIGGTGTTRSLTVQNTYSQTYFNTSTIRIGNTAKGNTLKYLNIEGSGQGSNTGTVIIGYGQNLNNTIDNNDIRAAGGNLPRVAILADHELSPVSQPGWYNVISNNLIHDFFSSSERSGGILLDANSQYSTISGNSIYQTIPITGETLYQQSFIGISYGGGDTIRNNFIGGSAPNAGGGPAIYNGRHSIAAIMARSSTYDTTIIEGNIVTNFSITNNTSNTGLAFMGIYPGGIPVAKVTGNTIGSLTTTGAITCTYTTPASTGGAIGMNCIGSASANEIILQDNKVGGLTVNAASGNNISLVGIRAGTMTKAGIQRNVIGGPVAGSLQLNAGSGTLDGLELIFQAANAQYTCSQNTIRHLYNNSTGAADAITNGITATLYPDEGKTATSYITGNRITHLHTTGTAAMNGSVTGIYSRLFTTANNSFVNNRIRGNQIDTLSSESSGYSTIVTGIGSRCPYNQFLDIDSNNIHTLRNAAANTNMLTSAAVQGIGAYLPFPAPLNINGNSIYDLESTATVTSAVMGINVLHKSVQGPCTLSKNRIYDLKNEHVTGGTVVGMALRGSTGTGAFVIKNNMISLFPYRAIVYGIWHNATATTMKLYYNSIAIGGTAEGRAYSGAFYRDWGVNTGISSVNNIFHNTRTGGTGRHYAIRNDHPFPSTGWTNSDFNDLYSSNPATIASWRQVSLSLSRYQDSSGQDLSSKSVLVDFADALHGDLHLQDTDSNRLLAGISLDSLDIKDDFDGNLRHDPPAMGASEILIRLPPLFSNQQLLSRVGDPAPNDAGKKQLLLYPNPATDIVKVSLAGYDETVTVAIFDISGREKMNQKIHFGDPGTSVINVQPLTAGTYLLRLTTSKGTITKWFVKM